MSKTLALLLSISLAMLAGAPARAQYQDPRLNNQVDMHDNLDAVYDQINDLARQKPAILQKPVKDRHAYDQFMNQTGADLAVEQANTARTANARRNDALTTGAYEQKHIEDMAAAEREQARNARTSSYGRGRHNYVNQTGVYSNNGYNYSTATPELQAIEAQRVRGLTRSQENVERNLAEGQAQADTRDQALTDAAENLRDQILSSQSSSKKFGLQGVGTNLYVRQYVPPETPLPPVHGAAARIVPYQP